MEVLKHALSPEFMPHGYCYAWDPLVLWLHVVSDGLIALSYYCIPVVLIYFIRKNRDIPFNRIFWMFGTFILACGTTHLMEIWNVWHGDYLLAGLIKGVTAAVSVLTAVMLIPLVPKVMSVPVLMHLQEENRKLQAEIARNQRLDAPIEGPMRRRVAMGFIVAVLVTIFVGLFSWYGAHRADQDSQRVAHTYGVAGTIAHTTMHLIEVETTARAFSLSGQERLLVHYQQSQESVRRDEADLRHLAAGNPSQERRLEALSTEVVDAFDFADRIIAKRRKLGPYPGGMDALEIERHLDVVRAITQDMQDEEERRLEARIGSERSGQRLTRLIALLGVLIGVTLWGLARVAVNREIAANSRARRQLGELNAELEQRVEHRTAALKAEMVERERSDARNLRLAAIVDSSNDAILSKDLSGNILSWNPGAESLFGYSEKEVVGKSVRVIVPEHRWDDENHLLSEIEQGRRFTRYETTRVRKDGSEFAVSLVVSPIRDAAGKVIGISSIAHDITQRKLAEQQLQWQTEELSQQAEELAKSREALEAHTLMMRSVLDSMAEGLVAADEQGKFLIWNPAAERIVGQGAGPVPPAEWSKHYKVFLPDTMTPFPEAENPLVRAIGGESSTAVMFIHNPETHEGVWIEVNGEPLRNKGGEIRGGVVAFRDITQRRRNEHEIRTLNAELEERVQQRTAELQITNQELESFTYSVSHDLRAPLRHISGFSKILEEEFGPALPPDGQRHLQRIQDGSRRMGLLVDGLLGLARLGRQALRKKSTALEPMVRDVVQMLDAEKQAQEVEWKIGDLPVVECDATLVRQVFQNLISNALKYSRPRPKAAIEIGEIEKDGERVFFIRDNGVGFSMKYADKLFGVFQRLHKAEDFEGTGVGLATVQRIVQKHGGKIWAEAELDKGATFYFTLGSVETGNVQKQENQGKAAAQGANS